MIKIADHKQEHLFDPWDFLSPIRRQMSEESWPGLFNEVILYELPVSEIAPYFNQGFGRPTKELHTVIGVLILQQTHDLTDALTVEQPAFNIQWHYALQNPSDPDAAYSGHKGLGYQVQVMVTYTETSDEQEKAETLNLITYVETEKACQSDAQALIPAIETADERDLGPREVQADSLYGSDVNSETAKDAGVELVAPTMGARQNMEITLADFEFSDDGHVVSCPKGNKPDISNEKDGRFSQGFDPVTCAGCPYINECPVKAGKKYYYLRYDNKDVRIAKRRKYEQSDEFKV